MNKKYFWSSACLSFVLGLLFSFYVIGRYLAGDVFLFSLCLFFLFLNRKNFSNIKSISSNKKKLIFKYLLFFLLFFSLGLWRQQISFNNKKGNISNYLNKEFTIRAEVISNPEIKNNRQKIKVKILSARENDFVYNLNQNNNFEFHLQGKILISTLSAPRYQRGDIIEISGEYLAGGMIEDFNYSLYLKRFDIDALSYYPEIKKISQIKKNLTYYYFSFFDKVKDKINNNLESNLSFDSSALVSAMFLGNKNLLSDDLKNIFSRAGLSHIIAISGMHISLLTAILLQVLSFLGLSRRRSFYVCVLFLISYLCLIGAPASALRASLMGFLALLALYMGRSGNLPNALFLSAFLMLMFNPWLLVADIGFQLSFLAVLSIIFLYPHLKEYLKLILVKNKFSRNFYQTKIGESILDIFSITIAVQVFSAPVLISSFKQISLIAPLANLLVVFLLPLIISLILLALFFSLFSQILGSIFYYILDLLISYICLVGKLSSQIPYASWEILSWNFYFTFIYYLCLIYFLYKKNRPTK